ncbi:tyrosine-protein phosphatase [Paenibacillus sp. CMAA1364]
MIDIHCHILPGIDDGPQLVQQAIELARSAVANGMTTVIATPHHLNGRYNTPAYKIHNAVDKFNNVLRQHQIPLHVEPGQEVHVHPSWMDELYKGQLCTLANSQYILLEFPTRIIPHHVHVVIHELKKNGLIPIVAHPERNYTIVNTDRIRDELLQQGVLFQITAQSLVGHFGRRIQKWCFQLCKKNQIHFVASDAHDTIRRRYMLQEAYASIADLCGVDRVSVLQRNARDVLENRPIIPMEPQVVKRRGLWRLQ